MLLLFYSIRRKTESTDRGFQFCDLGASMSDDKRAATSFDAVIQILHVLRNHNDTRSTSSSSITSSSSTAFSM